LPDGHHENCDKKKQFYSITAGVIQKTLILKKLLYVIILYKKEMEHG